MEDRIIKSVSSKKEKHFDMDAYLEFNRKKFEYVNNRVLYSQYYYNDKFTACESGRVDFETKLNRFK